MLSTAHNQSVIAQIQAKLGIYPDGSVQLELQFSNDDFIGARTHTATPTRTPPQQATNSAADQRSREMPTLNDLP